MTTLSKIKRNHNPKFVCRLNFRIFQNDFERNWENKFWLTFFSIFPNKNLNISKKVFYYIPFGILLISSLLICRKLHKSSRHSRNWRRHRHAVIQLALVVVSFLIGYLPSIAYYQFTFHDPNPVQGVDMVARSQKIDYWVI